MTCDEARESLSALLDEALAPDERRAVEAHVESCAECRRELEGLRQTVGLLHRVVPAHAPVGFVDRVVAAARPRPWYRRLVAAVFLPLSAKLPAEATALIMVALLAAYTFERTPALREAARYEAPPSPAARQEAPAPLTDARKETPPPPPANLGARSGEPRGQAKVAREARPSAASPAPATPAPPPAAVPAPPPPASTETPSTPRPEVSSPARPEAPPAARSETQPAPRTDAPASRAEAPAESARRSEAESDQKALERAGRASGVAPGDPGIAAKRARSSADVVARVAVKDRDAAERDLAQLIAQVGGRQTERRREHDATVVEAVVPQSRYAEFSQALASIGLWRVESERPDLPSEIHVILRLQ